MSLLNYLSLLSTHLPSKVQQTLIRQKSQSCNIWVQQFGDGRASSKSNIFEQTQYYKSQEFLLPEVRVKIRAVRIARSLMNEDTLPNLIFNADQSEDSEMTENLTSALKHISKASQIRLDTNQLWENSRSNIVKNVNNAFMGIATYSSGLKPSHIRIKSPPFTPKSKQHPFNQPRLTIPLVLIRELKQAQLYLNTLAKFRIFCVALIGSPSVIRLWLEAKEEAQKQFPLVRGYQNDEKGSWQNTNSQKRLNNDECSETTKRVEDRQDSATPIKGKIGTAGQSNQKNSVKEPSDTKSASNNNYLKLPATPIKTKPNISMPQQFTTPKKGSAIIQADIYRPPSNETIINEILSGYSKEVQREFRNIAKWITKAIKTLIDSKRHTIISNSSRSTINNPSTNSYNSSISMPEAKYTDNDTLVKRYLIAKLLLLEDTLQKKERSNQFLRSSTHEYSLDNLNYPSESRWPDIKAIQNAIHEHLNNADSKFWSLTHPSKHSALKNTMAKLLEISSKNVWQLVAAHPLLVEAVRLVGTIQKETITPPIKVPIKHNSLLTGIEVTKYNYSSNGSSRKFIRISSGEFQWADSMKKLNQSPSSFPLNDILTILYGKCTPQFDSDKCIASQCMSLVLNDRTFDIMADNGDDCFEIVSRIDEALPKQCQIGYAKLLWKRLGLSINKSNETSQTKLNVLGFTKVQTLAKASGLV